MALDKILSTSAQNLIEKTTLLVKERFNNYLHPLSQDLIEIKNAINRGIVDPDNTRQFDRFLFESIRYNPEIFMVYYGTAEGDFYGVDREQKGIIGLTHVINSKSPPISVRYELNEQGEKIQKKILTRHYDPRVRPWYQEAVAAGKPIWTEIYQFYVFEKSDFLVPGITAAAPIYDKNQKLKGVIALDLTVDGLQEFIRQLDVTGNTMIYVTNNESAVIAFRDPNHTEDLRGEKLGPDEIKKYNIPLKDLHFQNRIPLQKSYMHNDKEYFLAYHSLETINPERPWHITIIVPEHDVLAPLKALSMRTFILTILVLIIGAFIARFLSQRISKPIIQLANDAQEITRLNLTPKPLLNTIIKEISYMDQTLSTLRSSLTSFQRYVPSSLVKKLMKSGKIAEVGGQNQIITILFSDIKDFTHMAESTPPEQLMTYLSDYFQTMTDAVIQHEGTLDKYIGDAIMALWNAPTKDVKHPYHACLAARDMMQRVEKLNQKNRHQGIPEFTIRIGIHTGEAVVGNVGSEDRLSFTALGDSVNLASRLEAINKNYSTNIIVSKATYQEVADLFPFRLLDQVTVHGKQESTEIYELVTARNIENLEQHRKEFKKAFSLYQKGKWVDSIEAFEKLTPAYPGDMLPSTYIKRLKLLAESQPTDWDGIWREKKK
nr:adenylate/guanylate cyclase domain-containing protein [Legionella londiniensis]